MLVAALNNFCFLRIGILVYCVFKDFFFFLTVRNIFTYKIFCRFVITAVFISCLSRYCISLHFTVKVCKKSLHVSVCDTLTM